MKDKRGGNKQIIKTKKKKSGKKRKKSDKRKKEMNEGIKE